MSRVVEGFVRDGKVVLVDAPELVDGQRVHVVIDSTPPSVDESDTSSDAGRVHTPLEDPVLIDLLAQIRRNRPALPPSPGRSAIRSAAGMLADDPTWDEHLREVLEWRKTSGNRELPE
jgi:hypothetical protein